MKNKKLKTALSYIGIFVLAGVVAVSSSLSVYASRVSDYSNSPSDLATISRYNKAMETCIPGGLGGSFSYDYSGSGDYKIQNIQNSLDHLLGNRYFFNSYSGSLIYSKDFEDNVSEGNYEGGIFGSGNNDGKMYCGENNDALLNKAFNAFGLTKDTATMKSLACSGNNDGIYTITKKRYDDNYKVVEEDSKCSENFDLFVRYAENKVVDPEYSISVSVSSNAGSHYKSWFKSKVGDLGSLSADQKKAMDYAEAAHNFQTLCSVNGPSDSSFGSKSEVKIYDAFSGKADAGKEVYYQIGVDANDKFYTGINSKTEQTCADMAASLNKDGAAAYTKIKGAEAGTDGDNNTPPPIDENTSATGDPCYSGDIESMSWILCPATKNMAKATDGLNGMIEDMLAVDTDLYSQTREDGSASGTYIAWGYFRDIANIAMIIVIMIVIFSQLTGTGIDNYGIKKLLPKLIVSAVLVNLSYIICTLAIDLSNILGSSLNLMFQSIGKTIGVENYAQITISSLVTGILGAVTAAGAGAALIVEGISLLGTSGATTMVLIIPLLIALLIAIVAVVMFYVMLGARMIIIIIFTALSPLAFVCNILPNTQSLFKKWLDVMKAALIMFPICGALYGLSFVIKAIVFSTDGVHIWMGIVAVFSPFIPFLVMPTLLKSAISALGVVGQKLAGIGDTMKGSLRNAQSAVRNSEQYREAARLGQLQHGNWRANRTLNGTKGIGRRHIFARKGLNSIPEGDLTESQARRRLDAQRAVNAYEAERAEAKYGVPVVSQTEAEADVRARRYQTEVKRITDQFSALSNKELFSAAVDSLGKSEAHRVAAISSMASRGMNKEMLQFLHEHGDKNEIKGSGNVLSAVMSSKEGVAFNWAKEQNKLDAASRVGFSSFTSDATATNADGSFRNSLAGVAAKNGEAFVDSLTDDSMDYLGGRLSNPGDPSTPFGTAKGVVSANNWLKKLAATNKGKEQTAIIKNLTSGDYATISPTLSQLSRISGDAFGEGIEGDTNFANFMSRIEQQSMDRLKQDYQIAKQKGTAANMDNRFRDWFEQNP